MARSCGEGPSGISAFLIETGTPGMSFGGNERKTGWNAQPTRTVSMDNVRVPAANMLGAVGQGFKIAMSGLNGGRLNIAACSLVGAQGTVALIYDGLMDISVVCGLCGSEVEHSVDERDLSRDPWLFVMDVTAFDRLEPA